MIVLLLSLSAPLAIMALHVLLHRTIYARRQPKSRIHVLFCILIGVTAAWGVLATVVFSRLPLLLLLLNTAYVIVVGFCLGYCYFHVFALSETGLRIRFLLKRYLAQKEGATAWEGGSAEDYDPSSMLKVRIDRLLAMGAAREEQGKIFAVNGPLLFTAKFTYWCRSIWRSILFGPQAESSTEILENF